MQNPYLPGYLVGCIVFPSVSVGFPPHPQNLLGSVRGCTLLHSPDTHNLAEFGYTLPSPSLRCFSGFPGEFAGSPMFAPFRDSHGIWKIADRSLRIHDPGWRLITGLPRGSLFGTFGCTAERNHISFIEFSFLTIYAKVPSIRRVPDTKSV